MSELLQDIGYAKINLALHVRARRADGYHDLETLFAFAEDGDVLTASPAADVTLAMTGPFAAGLSADADNLVLRAARTLAKALNVETGIAFTLDKRLPIAAGIGGGSADAAAALRLAAQLWGVSIDTAQVRAVAAQLGADVPACLSSRTCFGTGTGTDLAPCGVDVAGLPILLVNPNLACPTGPVFQAWDVVDRGPLVPDNWRTARNDLQDPAQSRLPEIGDVLAQLNMQAGVSIARMSGSGATCFAIFETSAARDAAAQSIKIARPGWWILPTRLR
ncbi:MAG: 4-(cytidine 5'-diphospho)-2-C-methyl-D-erythritol kinase [Alphaproteobacteria bacterium]|nr:4-(cytidine 5'-diphospho)-2-C-methyl-D-erythritol kinase [Alphaproteobacteria bacterium]